MKLAFVGKYKLSFFAIFYSILLVVSCSPTDPPKKDLPNEMFADLSGVVNFKYESPLWPSSNPSNDYLQEVYGGEGTRDIDNVYYGLVVSLFFLDKTLKTGTFKFVSNSAGQTTDYAVGGFIIGKDPDKRSFISDSGSVTITEITSYTVSGTFNFYASEINGTGKINVLNGILSIK